VNRSRDAADWDRYLQAVADISTREAGEIRAQDRLVADLGIDSLGLAELLVYLIGQPTVPSPPHAIERDWDALTVEELYDACRCPPNRISFEMEQRRR
jgi:acyl carrier protein